VEWRITAMDRWGNWSVTGWPLRTPSPQLVWFPFEAGSWSLLAEGVEYISAGFVGPLTNGLALPVAVGERANLFGVRWLVAVGPGDYRIENGIPSVQSRVVSTGLRSTLDAAGVSNGTNWVVNLRATEPGVLCVSEGVGGVGDVKARTRIHDGRNDYRITSTNAVLQLRGRRLHFQFFSRNIPPDEGPLEVEVYGSLPPATFYVQ
jgi:hypothetical protein